MKATTRSSLSGIKFLTCLIFGLGAIPSSAAELEFTGDSINLAGSWNILPGPGTQKPTNGDTGTIAVDGVIGSTAINFGDSVVTQTAGTISTDADNNNLNFLGGGVYHLVGGRIETRGIFSNSSTINLSGGFIQLGSTASDSVRFGTVNDGVMTMGGTVEITALKSYIISNDGDGSFDISSDWSGTWSHPGYPVEGTWQETLVDLGISFDGAAITDENFGSIFSLTNAGQTLSLTNPVAPPSSDDSLAITKFEYVPATNTVTLTWNAEPAVNYTVKYSIDLNDWEADLSDSITIEENDEDPNDGNFITTSFDLEDFVLQDISKLFFRIETTP